MSPRSRASPPTSLGQKLALIAFGVVVALIALELGMRAAGVYLLRQQERQNRISLGERRSFTILCIGESTTALGGSRSMRDPASYPQQLQSILNRWAGRPLVSVVNKGVPAVRTDWILAHVPEWLDTYRPDAVVAMMGINDRRSFRAGGWAAMGRRLASFRVYKLATFAIDLVASRWREDDGPGRAPAAKPDAEVVARREAALRERLESDARDPAAAADLGIILMAEGRPAEAQAWLERADDETTAFLAACARAVANGKEVETPRHAERGQSNLPPALLAELARRYCPWSRAQIDAFGGLVDRRTLRRLLEDMAVGLVVQLAAAGRIDDARALGRWIAAAPGAQQNPALEERMFAMLALAAGQFDAFERHLERAAAVHRPPPSTERNYRALRRLLGERDVTLVAVQYPLRPVAELRRLLDDDPTVVFVDNGPIFRSALRRVPFEALFSDAFAGDFGHGTSEGNRMLAENIASEIWSRVLAPPRARPAGE